MWLGEWGAAPHHREPFAEGQPAQRGEESDGPDSRNKDNLSCKADSFLEPFRLGSCGGLIAVRAEG